MNNQAKQTSTQNIFIYFSQLLDRPVKDKKQNLIGRLYDIMVKPTEVYPQSAGLIIRKGFTQRKYALIPWSDIAEIEEREILLRTDGSSYKFLERHNNKEELTLRRDILDQQVVDTFNHKVIRVNDIHLLSVDHSLMIAHVDISFKGLLRRLGCLDFVLFLIRIFNKKAKYLTVESLISWKHIQPLSINPVSMTIKVDVPEKQFGNIPAADLGEIFLDLNIKDKIALFKALDLNTRAKIFVSIDFKSQKSIVSELQAKEISEILNAIPPDEATDFLEKLPKTTVDRYLSLIESKRANKLSQLLGYSSDSAGGLMTTEYLAFLKDTPVESVLNQIKEHPFKGEPAQFVYIVDEQHRLIAATNFRLLIKANPSEPIQKAAFRRTYFVHLDSTVKEVACLMERYKYFVIPVVDENNTLHGIITVDDILNQVISIAWRRLAKIKVRPKQ